MSRWVSTASPRGGDSAEAAGDRRDLQRRAGVEPLRAPTGRPVDDPALTRTSWNGLPPFITQYAVWLTDDPSRADRVGRRLEHPAPTDEDVWSVEYYKDSTPRHPT